MTTVSWTLAFAQYGDSAYPSGGVAQSWGLETAVAEGHVRDVATLTAACTTVLRHGTARADAVAAAACCRAADVGDADALVAVDRMLTATRAAHESRVASARLGRRLLETAAGAEDDAWLAELLVRVREGRTPGNHAAAIGAVCGRLGGTAEDAAALALWATAAGYTAAAPRLMRITHNDTQRLLSGLRGTCADLAVEAAAADPTGIASGVPLAEIWAMRHETATTRLFAS